MGSKRRIRSRSFGWDKEDLPPAGAEVQVYRRRQDDRKRWEYLGRLEVEYEVELDYLEATDAEELYNLIPFGEAQTRWAGGEYQFRFWWRDEEGRRERKGSSNGRIAGQPRPRL